MITKFHMIALDCETGGFDKKKDALLSIALLKLDENFDVLEKLYLLTLPEPGFRILDSAAEVNGYSEESWEERGAIPLSIALKSIYSWIQPTGRWSIITPLAHNASFDQRFIDFNSKRLNIDLHFNYAWRCSRQALQLWRDITKTNGNCKLDSLRVLSGFTPALEHHDALDDTLACAAGYKWLVNEFKKHKET